MVTVTLIVLFLAFSSIIIQESHGVTLNVKGIVASAFTPFLKNGRVNYDLIPKSAEFYKDNGIVNIVLVGYAGEGPSLGLNDRKAVISKWVEAGTPLGLKFIVDVGAMPLFDTVQLVKFCSELEVEAILALPEIIYKGNLDEVIRDLQIISDAAPDLPLIIEDINFATNPLVSPEEAFVAASKKINSFAGILTTMNTALRLRATQSLQGFTVIIRGYDQIAATFATNFDASISIAVNLFPKVVLSIATAYRNKNYKEVAARQDELSSLLAAIVNLNNTVVDITSRDFMENQKEAHRLIYGIDFGLRIPLIRPTRAESRKIADNLKSLGVKLKGRPQ